MSISSSPTIQQLACRIRGTSLHVLEQSKRFQLLAHGTTKRDHSNTPYPPRLALKTHGNLAAEVFHAHNKMS